MQFRISDTFTESLARLRGEEQKAVKTTAFDLQIEPSRPGLGFHKLDHARDKNFWSVRVNQDIRLIVHRTADSLLLCYVGHHDDAYRWAERRKLETHPKTGAAQLVEVREVLREIQLPVPAVRPKPSLFANLSDDELLAYGIPPEWLPEVKAADEDSILALSDHLPKEAAEALLELAVGGKPEPAPVVPAAASPFEHPDAQRRFRLMHDVEELERALEFPWEKWTVFLHPAQRQIVEADYAGPARVSGSAGTGKTIVALHRAVFLARNSEDARVLLTTFSDTLASRLRTQLRHLISNEPRLAERLEVHSMDSLAQRLHALNLGRVQLASRAIVREMIAEAAANVADHRFTMQFLLAEWEQVVDAWQLVSWEEYRDVARLGRRIRLPEQQRNVLWSMFERVRADLRSGGLMTQAEVFTRLSELYRSGPSPFTHIVVDEAQDVSIAQLRFLAAIGAGRPNGLFFAGDLGQRIFQQPLSWSSLGVEVRGRSRTLRVNYRTSHQIRSQADRLLGPEMADVDGNVESRRGTVSLFNGPAPMIAACDSQQDEIAAVSNWLIERAGDGVLPHEIGVFVRAEGQMDRARAAVEGANLHHRVLHEQVDVAAGFVSVTTMHMAKGLEFRAVAVMACDDEVIPLQERIETVADESELQEVYDTERHLLYVSCTRARDHLLITSGDVPSEFLDDLGA
jgi:superfamily I DNA/RNA helicase/mRNA-degrading endonuclease RelE of RelBE toxin-antitoxin system